jgi:hypothetical protein
MTAHPNRCKHCKFGFGNTGSHWCYRYPESNGEQRQWIEQNIYDSFIAILGCASFEYCPEEEKLETLNDLKDKILIKYSTETTNGTDQDLSGETVMAVIKDIDREIDEIMEKDKGHDK